MKVWVSIMKVWAGWRFGFLPEEIHFFQDSRKTRKTSRNWGNWKPIAKILNLYKLHMQNHQNIFKHKKYTGWSWVENLTAEFDKINDFDKHKGWNKIFLQNFWHPNSIKQICIKIVFFSLLKCFYILNHKY